MTKSLPNPDLRFLPYVDRSVDDLYNGHHIKKGFVRGLAVGGVEGSNRYGELVVEDVCGIASTFKIIASHQYPIPEDTYTLLGANPALSSMGDTVQYWVVGQLSNNLKFEKVSVFQMTDSKEIERLNNLGLSVESRFILA